MFSLANAACATVGPSPCSVAGKGALAGLAAANAVCAPVVSSLVSVAAFGTTTAANYALDGLVDWEIAAFFIGGGGIGGWLGTRASNLLAKRKRALNFIFAAVIILVGIFISGQWAITAIT